MVRDGYFYGLGSIVAAALLGWLTAWPYALPVLLLGAFCLWFFRDPVRHISQTPVDVLLERNANLQVKVGDRVMGGESVLALLQVAPAAEAILAGERRAH